MVHTHRQIQFPHRGGPPNLPNTDFNHDGKPDYLLYAASTRRTAVWYMNNNVFVSGVYGPTLPPGWSLAGVADFNGDGNLNAADYVVWRKTSGPPATYDTWRAHFLQLSERGVHGAGVGLLWRNPTDSVRWTIRPVNV